MTLPRSYYIETYGCTSNKSDSYILSNILSKSNYVQSGLEQAEIVIINTCAVKQQTENKIKTRLKELYDKYKNNKDKYFIIAGCLPHIDEDYINVVRFLIPNFAAIIDLDNINDILDVVSAIKSGERNLIVKSDKKLDKSKFHINYGAGKITGIVPISEGCLGSCTYCCVKNARGRLNCYDPVNVINNVKYQLKQGIKQIYLTSQDCSTYTHKNVRLVDLIQRIVNLDYKFFLRIGMLNPSFLRNNYEQLETIYRFDKVYRFLHVPIQSGSDDILARMERYYTINEIREKLERLRRRFPMLTLSTDIICGFPGETEEHFLKTLELIRWLKPEILNISKFTPRPGTKAKQMKQVESRIIKERSIRLSKVFRESLVDINRDWLDWEGEILLLHEGSEKNQVFGRNFAYKNIFIEKPRGNYGEFIKARVNKVDGFNLFAEEI